MKYASSTDIGKRADNEDSFLIPDAAYTAGFVAVSDGMGGHAAGAVASGLVIQGLREELPTIRADEVISQLRNAIQQVNLDVYRTAEDDRSLRGMGATLVCAALFDKHFVTANVGDSRLYHFDGERISQVTTDHTLVEMLVESGAITAEEARCHPQRNLITRAMGIGVRTDIDLFDREWKAGDILLLCSDGLSGSLTDDEMLSILRSGLALDAMCGKLVRMALDHGATDNVTVVLAQCEGGDCA